MLRRTLICLTSLTLLSLFSCGDKPKTDKQLMQGAWQVTEMRARGTDIDVSKLGEGGYVFTDNKLKITGQGLETVSELTFRPKRQPKEIDMKAVAGVGAGKTVFGIYRFKDGKLILCIGDTRPEQFSGDGEAGLLVLEPVKKHD